MKDERIFSINEISYSNLDALCEHMSNSCELRSYELSLIADSILKTAGELYEVGMNAYEMLTLLSSELPGNSVSMKTNDKKATIYNLQNFSSQVELFDKVELSSILTDKFEAVGRAFYESDFLPEYNAEQTFTYVRNSLSDEAYDVFSQQFDDPRVNYSDSFKQACFAVADGEVGYCILPLEERGGMRIPGIASLISALDLKVVAVTPVFGLEGTADMKYALVGRGFKIPPIEPDNDRYLEIKLDIDSRLTPAMLLSAAEALGLSVYKAGTMTIMDNGEPIAFYSVIFKDGGGGFVPFLVFLTLFAGEYTPIGIYENLE